MKIITMLTVAALVLAMVNCQEDGGADGEYGDYYGYGDGDYYYGNYDDYNYGDYYGNYSDYYGDYYGNYSDYYGDYYGNYSDYYDYDDEYDYSEFYSAVEDYDNDDNEPSAETADFTDCGGEITELPSAIIKTPGYPSEGNKQSVYPNNAYCKWWFNGDEKTLVRFKMWDLVIEIGEGDSNVTCDFDYLNITITSIGSKRYCGYTKPEEEIRGKGSFTIIFVSDATTNYRGMQGTYQITENFDPCDPSPCGAQGTCEVLEDLMSVRCHCAPGFTGQRCEIDIPECNSNPCQNGGTCNDKIKPDYYECTCPEGYEGDNCETKIQNPCIPNPCHNDGACRNHSETTYSCNCTEHYKGQNCEIENFPPCFSEPCKNGGTCLDFLGEVQYHLISAPEGSDEPPMQVKAPPEYLGFNCTCDLKKYRGEFCEIDAGCSDPGIPELGDGFWFDPDSTVEFSCVGDYILKGSPNITCYADGSWSNPMPECVMNATAAAMKQQGPFNPWSGAMMALGAAFTVNLLAFTFWMVVKGPWKKVDRIISISHEDLRSQNDVDDSSYYDDDEEESGDSSSSGSYSSSSSSIRDVP